MEVLNDAAGVTLGYVIGHKFLSWITMGLAVYVTGTWDGYGPYQVNVSK